MSTEHTPWVAVEVSRGYWSVREVVPTGRTIASGLTKADAFRLEAFPDMLAALERAAVALGILAIKPDGPGVRALRDVRAAIAKARRKP